MNDNGTFLFYTRKVLMSQVIGNPQKKKGDALKRKQNICFACLSLFIFFVTAKNGELIELCCTTSSSFSNKNQFIESFAAVMIPH